MNREEILNLANKHLDKGLCFSRTARIIRATEDEIVAFAQALICQTENDLHGRSVENYMAKKYPNLF